jgi:hypothetical protein
MRRWFFAAIFLSAAFSAPRVTQAETFVMPSNGNLYLEAVGGEAAGVTTFGIGTSPINFAPFFSGLPETLSAGFVLAGYYDAGTTINFGEYTTFGGRSYWAFSDWTDAASVVAFSDIDNSLGLGGKIISQTGPNTWLMHLDDAASFTVDDDDNDVLISLKVVGISPSVPEPSTWAMMLLGFAGLGFVFRQLMRLRAS